MSTHDSYTEGLLDDKQLYELAKEFYYSYYCDDVSLYPSAWLESNYQDIIREMIDNDWIRKDDDGNYYNAAIWLVWSCNNV